MTDVFKEDLHHTQTPDKGKPLQRHTKALLCMFGMLGVFLLAVITVDFRQARALDIQKHAHMYYKIKANPLRDTLWFDGRSRFQLADNLQGVASSLDGTVIKSILIYLPELSHPHAFLSRGSLAQMHLCISTTVNAVDCENTMVNGRVVPESAFFGGLHWVGDEWKAMVKKAALPRVNGDDLQGLLRDKLKDAVQSLPAIKQRALQVNQQAKDNRIIEQENLKSWSQ